METDELLALLDLELEQLLELVAARLNHDEPPNRTLHLALLLACCSTMQACATATPPCSPIVVAPPQSPPPPAPAQATKTLQTYSLKADAWLSRVDALLPPAPPK